MSTSFGRFGLLLPLRFNDGSTVPDILIADTILELREHFGAVSCENANHPRYLDARSRSLSRRINSRLR